MSRRKWFVRALVFTVVGVCACAVFLYQRLTNPAAVRQQVQAKLAAHFPGAHIFVESARLRILGGIVVNELRLARKDDPDKTEILHVPTAVLYYDKEKILEGEFSLGKVELFRPRLRVKRARDGSWNLQGIGGTLKPNIPLPILVIHQGTLVFDDRGEGGTGKTAELTDVDIRLVNDPLAVVGIEGSATSEVAGKLRVSGQWQRSSQEITLTLKAQHIALAGIAMERLEKLCPAGTLVGLKLEGSADLTAEVAYHPGTAPPLSYDVHLEVNNAKVQHPRLPLPLEDVHASIRCSNGDLRLENLQARSGRTEIEAHGCALLPCIEQNFDCHLIARHLQMREQLFACLPEKVRNLYPMFQPNGLATFRADVSRRDGAWTALPSGEPAGVQLLPEDMGVSFVKFPFPIDRLTGTVDMNLLTKLVAVDVTGYTGPRAVFIKGTWKGDGPQAEGQFDIQATDIPLDEKLVNALLLPSFKKLAQSFNATGTGDIKAHIRRTPGAAPGLEYHNEFHVRFHDCAIRWDQFPYPLEKASGFLDIYPRHWEFRDGRGTHRGAEVLVQGGSLNRESKLGEASPGLALDITGRNLPVDDELHRALQPMAQLARSWDTFRPGGTLNFRAKIDHRSLSPEDVEVDLDVQGCTIEPAFFPYAMEGIKGKFHYQNNKLEIREASARHGQTRVTLDSGTVDLHRGGGHYTDLAQLHAEALVLDEDLLRALPKTLRGGAAAVQLAGQVQLKTRLVVAQAGEGALPDIFWDGQLWFQDAKLSTGIDWKGVTGTAAAVGRYNGRQLAGVNGNILLEEASLLGQPFRKLQAKLQVRESAPEVLLLTVKAPIFGGDISGEARPGGVEIKGHVGAVEVELPFAREADRIAQDLQLAHRNTLAVNAEEGVQFLEGRAVRPAQPEELEDVEKEGQVTANEKDRKITMKPVPVIVDPLLQIRNRLTGAPTTDNHEERLLPYQGAK